MRLAVKGHGAEMLIHAEVAAATFFRLGMAHSKADGRGEEKRIHSQVDDNE
jgi:hypothetical protein